VTGLPAVEVLSGFATGPVPIGGGGGPSGGGGGLFGGDRIMMYTVALAVAPFTSVIVYVNESPPLNPGFGV
jgi:hypothetical protein